MLFPELEEGEYYITLWGYYVKIIRLNKTRVTYAIKTIEHDMPKTVIKKRRYIVGEIFLRPVPKLKGMVEVGL